MDIEIIENADGLSKESLVNEITQNLDYYLELIKFSNEKPDSKQGLGLKILGFEECLYLKETELRTILIKLMPSHLLQDLQHIHCIIFQNQSLETKEANDTSLYDLKLTDIEAQGNYNRTLAKKVPQEHFVTVYSPLGMSQDKRVLKVLLLQAIVHDFGHGIYDHFVMSVLEDHDPEGTYLEWMNRLHDLLRDTPDLTKKTSREKKDEFKHAQEEIAEIVRMYVFQRKELLFKSPDKYIFAKTLFEDYYSRSSSSSARILWS